MSPLPVLDNEPRTETWWGGFFRRISWAIKAFKASKKSPVIHLGNGVTLNIDQGIIVVDGDLDLHSTGNLRLSARKHLILQSGQDQEERPGYLHSIWLNPIYDDNGRPVEDPEILEIEEFSHESDETTE